MPWCRRSCLSSSSTSPCACSLFSRVSDHLQRACSQACVFHAYSFSVNLIVALILLSTWFSRSLSRLYLFAVSGSAFCLPKGGGVGAGLPVLYKLSGLFPPSSSWHILGRLYSCFWVIDTRVTEKTDLILTERIFTLLFCMLKNIV